MAENKIIGYKKLFGFVLPDWVDEKIIKLVASGLVSIAVIFLILIFLVWPNLAVADTKNAQLKASKIALTALKNSKQGIDQVQTTLGPKDIDLILSAIPQQYSPETAVYLLRKICNDSGVVITSYSLPSGTILDTSPIISNTVKVNAEMVEFTTFPIRITVAAPVDALLNFISKLESSLPFGSVSDLNLQEVTKLSSSVSNKNVQLSLGITFYQSNLRSVNINKVQPFTDADLTLAKDLNKFNVLVASDVSDISGSETVTPVNDNIFGL